MITLNKEEKLQHEKGRKFLLWLSMGGMSMAFAGLTSAYIVRKGAGNWLQFELPSMFYVSTAIILLSSVTMNMAVSAAKKGNFNNIRSFLIATLILGLGFVFTQFEAWSHLINQNIFFTGKTSNAAGSFLFVLTGLHMAHLAGGIIALIVTNIKSLKNKYTPENHLGITLCAIYWHFLDALWVYLFLFLYFIR